MSSGLIAEIDWSDPLTSHVPDTAVIRNARHLSSYSWLDRPSATIAVPGSPPLWTGLKSRKKLKKDSGLFYINQNQARHPESPLEPLFCALYLEIPSFDIRSVDVVTDRNNIRKLLAFLNPPLNPSDDEPFTIDVEIIGTTTLFRRDGKATTRFIAPNQSRGFGHAFEKEYNKSQVHGSTGHHRIISYEFGGLNFLVRYEADGYVATETFDATTTQEEQENSLVASMDNLSFSPTRATSNLQPVPSSLGIRREGRTVPLNSILEIKTRSQHRPLSIHDVAPQLWVSQTFNLVRAYHEKGYFQVPKVENVASELHEWEKINQDDLKRLASLFRMISNLTMRSGGKSIVKYEPGKKLALYKTDRKDMLPHSWYAKWREGDDTQVTAKSDTHPTVDVSDKLVDE
ncbi:hypothetical protein ACLX1H_001043 [Fusarium chlamydosporum]